MGFIPFFHHHGRENMFGWFTFSKHFCSANPNLSAVSFMAGCFPKTPPTMIIFSRKTPWLLGKPTILGSPYFAGKKNRGWSRWQFRQEYLICSKYIYIYMYIYIYTHVSCIQGSSNITLKHTPHWNHQQFTMKSHNLLGLCCKGCLGVFFKITADGSEIRRVFPPGMVLEPCN